MVTSSGLVCWSFLVVVFEGHFDGIIIFGGHFWKFFSVVVFRSAFWRSCFDYHCWWILLVVISSGLVCWSFLEVVFWWLSLMAIFWWLYLVVWFAGCFWRLFLMVMFENGCFSLYSVVISLFWWSFLVIAFEGHF